MKHLSKFENFNESFSEDNSDFYDNLIVADRFLNFLKEEENHWLNSKILSNLNDKTGLFDDEQTIVDWFEENGEIFGVESLHDLIANLKEHNIDLLSLSDKLKEITNEIAETREEVIEEIETAISQGFTFYVPLNFSGYRVVLFSKEKFNKDFKTAQSADSVYEDLIA